MAESPIREMNQMTDMEERPGPLRQLAIELFIVLAIGFALGLLGPFGSYAMPVGARLLYWMGFGLVGYAIFRPINIGAEWAAEATKTPLWLAVILSGLIAAVPMTLLIAAFLGLLQIGDGYLQESFLIRYLQIGGIGIAIYGFTCLIFSRDRQSGEAKFDRPSGSSASVPPAGVSDTKLHAELPQGFPPIIALSVEDHYVRVHAAERSEMLLMTLSAAIEMMPSASGLQTHRGWWIVRDAVTGNERSGRNLQLILANRVRVPVSRANVANIRAAGLLT